MAECAEKIRDTIEARKAYEHIRNLATKINYKRCIAIARKTTRQKKENFKKFAISLNRFTNMAYVWKKMNVFKNEIIRKCGAKKEIKSTTELLGLKCWKE